MVSIGRIFLILLPLLTITSSAHAKTVISVSSEGDSRVSVESNTSYKSSNSTVTTNTGRTDITVECNGVKKEYHSDEGGNVQVECENGEAIIETSPTTLTSPTSPTNPLDEEKQEIEEKVEEVEQEIEEERDEVEVERQTIITRLRTFFQNLLQRLSF